MNKERNMYKPLPESLTIKPKRDQRLRTLCRSEDHARNQFWCVSLQIQR